ncbi:MAG: hypothetical protein ABI693_22370, partial [Bryobacteraceae bacterium]
LRLRALSGSVGHDKSDLAEDLTDAGSHAGHDCAGSHCYEARHESILDQILATSILPKVKIANKPGQFLHATVFLSPRN